MPWIRSIFALVAVLVAPLLHAEWLLKPGAERVQAGQVLEIVVFLVNDGNAPIAEGMPARLPADARSATGAATVTLEAIDPPPQLAAPIAPGSFRKQSYRVRIPDSLSGTVQIALERVPSARLHIAVDATAETTAPKLAARERAELRVDSVPEPVLSPHEPMYFLAGVRGADTARFQLSFKYRLFDERGALARFVPGLSQVHFGFTQTSLWDIGGSSAPFRDTSYRPSLFYYEPQVIASGGGRFLMGLEAGIEHESNGRDGLRSRSLNIVYAKPSWRWFVDDEHYFSVAPKTYVYLERDDNADIGRYRGHVDLSLRYGKRDGWLFSSVLRKGSGPYRSLQLDASYPIREPFFANAGGFIHFQYFNGYGDTLLDYNVRHSPQFRIGFSIVR
ncbi:MAG: phospholipase A [Burkholderiales bacterium]|nr:phospholipase A [Burkholderiales bacterium]